MDRVRADQSRALTRGEGVLVAMLDSDLDQHHPELAGAVDGTLAEDCVAPESPPREVAPGSSHGTHVAGLIAAADARGHRHRSRRAAGPDPGGRRGGLRPPRVRRVRAAAAGAQVANSSFLVESARQGCAGGGGSPVPREAVRRAVEHATASGVLTVAAVGNHRIDLSALHGPRRASCDAVPVSFDGVLAVSAVGDTLLKAGHSSCGLGAVDLAAPGGDSAHGSACVLSTVPGAPDLAEGAYGTACGTSMAAPHVSGRVAALVASQHPQAGPAELTSLLTERAAPLACPTDYDLNADTTQDALCRGYADCNGFYGHGLVDALRSVTG